MNLKHIRAALAVQRTGSLTCAAESVFLSQSAVSQAIKSIEKHLGHKIFATSSTGAIETDGGRRFLLRAERAFEHIREIDELASRSLGQRNAVASRITMSQIRALVEVTERQNYSIAATGLGVSQPSVHKAIKTLEDICGIKLFTRRPNGVDPNWLARQMARRASLFLAELEQGIDELEEESGRLGGQIKVGALPLSQATIVPTATLEILSHFPNAAITIVDGPYEEQLKYLLHGQIDVIIGALRNPEPSPDICQEQLFSDPLCVVTGIDHPLAGGVIQDAQHLQKLRWIAPRANTPARNVFEQYFRNVGIPIPSKFIECSSLVAIRGLLMNSDFIALLPEKQVALDVEAGSLAIIREPLSGTSRDIGLATRKSWIPTTTQAAFLKVVRKITAQTFVNA